MADIKSAYRRLAKLYHPDLNPGSKQSEEKFKEILDAYTILSDDDLRAQYDRKRKYGSSYPDAYTSSPHNPGEKKRDAARKEYPPEYIEKMRQRNKTRIVKQIQRRKKILRGMIITFILYLIATAAFDSYIHRERPDYTAGVLEKLKRDSINLTDVIQNLDSPYDSVFGPGISTWLSPNQVVVINPYTDAVICLVQSKAPYRTIRNEFIHAETSFHMKDLPNGSYMIKVYSGATWKDSLKVPDGRVMGGFSTNERFFSILREPVVLMKPTFTNPHTRTSDTVKIDTSAVKIRVLTREEFFAPGDTL